VPKFAPLKKMKIVPAIVAWFFTLYIKNLGFPFFKKKKLEKLSQFQFHT
jgi:hypothetical protein